PQLRQQLLGELEHRRLRHRGAPLGRRLRVLLAQPLAHRRHPLQRELGDRALLLRQLGEHGRPVRLAGAEPLRLRPLRDLRRRGERRPAAMLAAAPLTPTLAAVPALATALAALGPLPAIAAIVATARAAAVPAVLALAGALAPRAAVAVPPGAPVVAPALGAGLHDRLELALGRQEPQQIAVL